MKTSGMPTAWRMTLAAFAAAALIAAGAGSGHVQAQETVPTWTPRAKARIGVLLQERCDESTVSADRCANPPIVTSVVVDGPADRAGVISGDTLLSIDGVRVTESAGRAALLALQAGVPVELELRREMGTVKLTVTPEVRESEPYVEVRTMLFGPAPDATDLEDIQTHVRVMRVPSVRSGLGDVRVRLDSLRSGMNSFVFFHQDSVGRFKIEVGDAETEGVTVDRFRYAWENEKLAERLVKVRDSSLRSARRHLDSLVSLQHRVRLIREDSVEAGPTVTVDVDREGRWAYFVGPRQLSGQVRSLFLTDLRIAGAEFRELDADLADYFDGADRGLLVVRVIPETPAARTGLRGGDVVVEVNGQECHQMNTLREAMAGAGPSGELNVVWIRKGERHAGRLGLD